MPRAKYTADPRVCPFCNQKRLFHQTMLVGDAHYVGVDACRNPRCRIDSFRGKVIRRPGGQPPSVDELRVRVEAIHAEVERVQLLAAKYTNEASSLRKLADEITASLDRSSA